MAKGNEDEKDRDLSPLRGFEMKKKAGGEGGIRTPDRGVSPYNGLANRRLQPLGHLSVRMRRVARLIVSAFRMNAIEEDTNELSQARMKPVFIVASLPLRSGPAAARYTDF